MKKILAIAILPILIFGFSVLTSCKNKSAETAQKKMDIEELDKLKEGIKRNVYPMKNAAEVVKMLSDYGIGYIPDLTNPPENIKKYFISSKQALNLGAYGSDLSYAAFYDVQQDVMNFLGVIRALVNELKMPKIYEESIYEKLKVNVDNKDSIVAILSDAFNETYYYLSENDQQILGYLVVGGAWVEGMHLTSKVSGAAYNITSISQAFLKQKESLNRFLEITKPYADDPQLKEFLTMIDPIVQVYASLSTSLTQKDINDLAKAIEGARAQMVQ